MNWPYISFSDTQLNAFQYASGSLIENVFNQINWTPQEIQRLEDSTSTNNVQFAYCYGPVSITVTMCYIY